MPRKFVIEIMEGVGLELEAHLMVSYAWSGAKHPFIEQAFSRGEIDHDGLRYLEETYGKAWSFRCKGALIGLLLINPDMPDGNMRKYLGFDRYGRRHWFVRSEGLTQLQAAAAVFAAEELDALEKKSARDMEALASFG